MKLKEVLFFICLILVNRQLEAVDAFSYFSNHEMPLSVKMPNWCDISENLTLKYESDEYYKKWHKGVKSTDFSGFYSGVSISKQLNKNTAFVFDKTISNHQTWFISGEEEKLNFSLRSKSSETDIKFIFKLPSNSLMEIGRIDGDYIFNGNSDLGNELAGVLGDYPKLKFNNNLTNDYFKMVANYKNLDFRFNGDFKHYRHKFSNVDEFTQLDINHDRKERRRYIEADINTKTKFKPYISYFDFNESGNGIDKRSNVIPFGSNKGYSKCVSRTIGTSYKHLTTTFFADYSNVNLDLSSDLFFNLVNIDPLFLFSTNYANYSFNLKADNEKMYRLGGAKISSKREVSFQYSLYSMDCEAYRYLSKYKTEYFIFPKVETSSKARIGTLYLHRADFEFCKKERNGKWVVDLNFMVPIFKSDSKADLKIGAGSGSSESGAFISKTTKDDKIRGGWQITLARVINI